MWDRLLRSIEGYRYIITIIITIIIITIIIIAVITIFAFISIHTDKKVVGLAVYKKLS